MVPDECVAEIADGAAGLGTGIGNMIRVVGLGDVDEGIDVGVLAGVGHRRVNVDRDAAPSTNRTTLRAKSRRSSRGQ
jgi:hypothetical protein